MKPSEYRQGDTLFMIRQFPPFEAMRVLGELQKVLAPLLGGAAKGANIDADIRSVAAWAGILGSAITELPKHLDGEKFEAAPYRLCFRVTGRHEGESHQAQRDCH